ncbi:MAG: 3-deoxy-D-manno-octulosonic acid transferase [Acidobacteriota bacterium]
MWILYQIAYALALGLAAPMLLLKRGRHYLPTLAGRLARRLPPAPPGGEPIWIHAVSVGEVGVAGTLVGALDPELPLVVTTVTPTGQERAHKTLSARAAIAYLPFEVGFAVNRFLRRFLPRALVLVEGDYWPLVLKAITRRGGPVAVVNGRVGDGSFRRMRRLRFLLGPLLGRVERFGVQSREDRDKLLALGVEAERVVVTGNLKFESPEPARTPELEDALRKLAKGRPLLIAGSTMEGEEELVLDAFEAAGDALLILAPRHPERWPSVAGLLEVRGIPYRRRSALDQGPPPKVVLLDSLGELAGLYRIATSAFIGGTLVPTGGHNPIEPARFGVATVVGPSMENFRAMAQDFDRAEAWEQVADAEALGVLWRQWVETPGLARKVGRSAKALVESNGGALAKTLEVLRPLLQPSESGKAP